MDHFRKKKRLTIQIDSLFKYVWCGWADSNRHACAHAPQTCVSTNFTTSAVRGLVPYGTKKINFFDEGNLKKRAALEN